MTDNFLPYLFRGPLKPSDNAVLDLVEVLHTLCAVDEQVGAQPVRPEAPDLASLGGVKLVRVCQVAGTYLGLLTRGHITL